MAVNDENEELDLIIDLLKSRELTYETHSTFYEEYTVKRDFSHHTVYVPDKKNFIFLISFDVPFSGYRFAKGKDYNSRYDKSIEDIEKEVKKYGRKRKV